MKEQLAYWLKTLSGDVRQGIVGNLAWVVLLVALSFSATGSVLFWSSIQKFLIADLQVWHLLLTLGVIALVVVAGLVVRRRRQRAAEVRRSALSYPTSIFRRTMGYGGVNWRLPGGDEVEGPFCPDG